MENAIKILKILLDLKILEDPDFLKKQERNRLIVFDKYRPIFSVNNIQKLDPKDFQDFLKYENNLHWTGLQRQGSNLCNEIKTLCNTIEILQDTSKPLSDRITLAEKTPYLGKAILSAILQVIFPVECGIWNEVSEEAMKDLGIFPKRNNETFGDYYLEINNILLKISKELRIDLWTMDTLLFYWGETKGYWPKIKEELLKD